MKKIFGLLTIGALGFALTSCTNANLNNEVSKISVVDSDPIDENTKLTPLKNLPSKADISNIWSNNDYRSFIEKYNEFSYDLLEKIGDNTIESNTAFSPLSIYMALSSIIPMLSDSAKQEVVDLFGMTSEEIYDNTKYLYSVSNNDYSILSNSLWYRDDIDLNSKVIKEIANVFYSEAYKVDFSKDLEKIYDYIKEKTNGLLDKCGDISPSTVLYVLNTLYFNDEWSFDFNVNGFKTASFENADNSYVNKKLYYSNYNDYERMYETDNYSSYHIRSKNGYEFTYVKPNGDKKVKDIYNKEVIKDVVCHNYFTSDEKYNYHTRLAFPEYSAEYNKCINKVISDMGANEIFNYSLKPFSRISNEDISVGEIWHRTKLDITKEGFKASAATSIDITLASTTSGVTKINKYETFYVDKSFFYVIQDNMGSILFSGVVNNVTND